ncbi:MAG: sugar phosphate isomerase/epimerase [Hyphomicrobiaceae bacterium]|nr:sugar phosphate isomerase/epimerase [Hyphomicrobiaceae bacterium]MCC0024523.1 sugar phosphate isomerase/epimerase [Hyphomicrobiaceae bacterium]
MDFSFQLYCARNFAPILDILPRLKALGYAQVEGFGGLYAQEPGLAEAVKAAGLTMPTGHFGLDMLKDTSGTMKLAEDLGTKILFCPAIPLLQRTQGEAGWVELAETLGELAETYKAAGFGFGWHNHDFEYRATASGKLPLDIMFETAPNLVWQHDIAWTARGGQDPIAWTRKYADRVVAIHVKDIAPAGECRDEDGWADVGHGTLDWPGIMKVVTSETKAQYFVMEHDNPSDVDRFARRSIEAARNFGV